MVDVPRRRTCSATLCGVRSIISRDGNDYLASGLRPRIGNRIRRGRPGARSPAPLRRRQRDTCYALLWLRSQFDSVWDEPPGALEVERNLRAWRRSVKLFTTQRTALTAFKFNLTPGPLTFSFASWFA